MNKQKAVFFDWDGTLSFDGNHIAKEDYNAIKELQAAGHLAFLCTGRSFAFIPEAALNLGFDGIVCGGGSHIIVGGKTIFHRVIPEDEVYQIICYFLQDGQTCMLEGERDMFQLNGEKLKYGDWPRIEKPEDFETLVRGCPITKFTLFGEMKTGTQTAFSDVFSMIVHPRYVEAILHGCSKAMGIERTLRHFGIERENSASFGDSPNDVDMLQFTALSIAMGNAPENVKTVADKITDSVENHGVSKGIRRWMINDTSPYL